MRDYYEFYINKFPEIDEIKFHAPQFADKKMGIDYFEIMEKEFQTNCMSYLGNFSDEEFVKECQKINITKLHEDITWLLTQPKTCYLGPTDLNELEMFFKVPSYYPKERKCVCFNSMAIQPNGDVVNCGDYPDLKFGNIKDEKITDLWNSMTAKKWRKFLDENGNPGVLSKCSRLFKTKKSSNF